MPKKSQSKAPAKRKTVKKAKAKQPAPEPEEEQLVLAQSAEVTHESGVLDDAAVVEALGQTEGESLDAFSATTSAYTMVFLSWTAPATMSHLLLQA